MSAPKTGERIAGDASGVLAGSPKESNSAAHAKVDAILQLVSRDHLDRLAAYFHDPDIHKIIFPSYPCASSVRSVGPLTKRRETGRSFLLLEDISLTPEAWVKWMAASPVRFVVTRMFFLDGGDRGLKQTAQSLDELVEQLTEYGAAGTSGPVRLQFGPRTMERVLLDRFESMKEDSPFVFHPVQSTASLHVFEFEDGTFRWSMRASEEQFYTSPDGPTRVPGSFTKAAAKLSEALLVGGMGKEMHGMPEKGKGMVAVDVGASPGGWTHQLAVGQRMETVIAVDPAELHETVLALENVHHVKKTSQTAEEDIEKILGPERKVHVLTCDANRPPSSIAEMLSPVVKYMAPGGLMVITMKFTTRRRKRQNELTSASGAESQLKQSFKELGYSLEVRFV